MLNLIFLLSIVYARSLLNGVPLNDDMALSVEETNNGLQITVTRSLTQSDGWFAVGFPEQNDPSMIGTSAYICSEIDAVSSVRVYDIQQTSTMQSSWLQSSPAMQSSCSFVDDLATLTFSVSTFDVEGFTIAFAMNAQNQRNPEGPNCFHQANKGLLTLNVPKEYVYRNLFPNGSNKFVIIASHYADNEVSVFDGTTVKLAAGATHEVSNAVAGSWVKSSKPLMVMGKTAQVNLMHEWISEEKATTSAYFYVHRNSGRIGIYALDDASVTVSKFDWTAGETELLATDLTSGSTSNFEWSQEEVKDKMLKVVSDVPILVIYWSQDNSDFITQEAPATRLYGCASSLAMVMNPSLATVTQTCTDGSVETWSSIFKKIRQVRDFDGESCVLSTDGALIMASSVGDGNGGNAVSWQAAENFSKESVIPADMNLLKIVSNTATTCTVGSTDYTLTGAGEVFHAKITTGVAEGTLISCQDGVMIFYDTQYLKDEGLLMMDEFEDPCSICTASQEVCGSDFEEYDSPCDAMCRGKTPFYNGNCNTNAPSLSPTTSQPTDEPTKYPTTSHPTEAPVSVFGDKEAIVMLKTLLAEQQRHMMLMQTQTEHDLRSRGSSGMTRIRAYATGTNNFNAEGGIANGGLLAMHDHPNFRGKMGLGEFGAVLNGIRFDTRHNDYKMRMPSPNSMNEYNELIDIEYPDVPPSVLAKETVAEQIEELQQYFKAFKLQDETIRDYKDYFKPALCYLEGAWIKKTENLRDFFNSDRHAIDALTWEHQHNAQMFRAASGKKHLLENTPFLPTKIIDVKIDSLNNVSYPVYANFEYRIACQPVGDIPTERFLFDNDQNVMQKFARGRRGTVDDDLMDTRMAHFKFNLLGQGKWEKNEEKGHPQTPPQGIRRNYLDTLMEQIPGKDGPDAVLSDDSFDIIVTKFGDQEEPLNTAKYSRYFSYSHSDAMGRQEQMRGYNDQNLFASMTTSNEIAGLKVCDEIDTTKCWEQKWTYAVPVEVVYLTPLENWNPYNLQLFEGKNAFKNYQNENGLDGSEEHAYVGYSEKDNFLKTPAEFYASFGGRDLADTGKAWYVDADGTPVQVTASGTRIITDNIGGDVGPVRLRWPVFPIHDHSTLAFREVSAVERKMEIENNELNTKVERLESLVADLVNLISTSSNFDALSTDVSNIDVSTDSGSSAEEQIRKWTESTYPVPLLITGPGFEGHTHDIWCDWSCFRSLVAEESVTITSEDWDGHTHDFTFKLGEDNASILFESCSTCDSMNDPHSSIDIAKEFGEDFLPFRL